jgi:hypothetical protein
MELTTRALWTLIHGMGFGGLYLLACSGALVELYRRSSPPQSSTSNREESFLSIYLAAMAVLAWLTVLSGTYMVYPWYRAVPPAGTVDLAGFPQRLLLSNASTSIWHSFGMEWKEHVAWLVPICITMAAVVAFQYGRDLRNHSQLRSTVLGFVWVSLFAAAVGGFFGAEIDDRAPINGGTTIHIAGGQ